MTTRQHVRILFNETGLKRYFGAVSVMSFSFAVMGTVAALWQNPVFIRMTPVGRWEVPMLVLLSIMSGVYIIVRRPFCDGAKSENRATAGGIIGFLGLACPVCNKILLLAFGGEFLLTYFDPIRVYVTMLGLILMIWVVLREWQLRFQNPGELSCSL